MKYVSSLGFALFATVAMPAFAQGLRGMIWSSSYILCRIFRGSLPMMPGAR